MQIEAKTDGIHSSGSVEISECTININTGDDGIYASGIVVKGGTIGINAGDDCLDAGSDGITIKNGSIAMDSYEVPLKSNGDISISGGTIIIDSHYSDGIDVNDIYDEEGYYRGGNIEISGGKLYITAFNEGLEASGSIEITGGSVSIETGLGDEYAFALWARDGITLGDNIKMLKPNGGKIVTYVDDNGTEETDDDTEAFVLADKNGDYANEAEFKIKSSGGSGGGMSAGGSTTKPQTQKSETQETQKAPETPSVSDTTNTTDTPDASEKKTFEDVHSAGHWAKDDVDYVSEKGLMNGTGETTFAPDEKVTRAMLVTVLYRNEGNPTVGDGVLDVPPFSDVDLGAYYGNAVIWAKQNGIVNGINENEFSPDAYITREQIAAIMFRYAQFKGMETMTLEENLHFADAGEISEYAISAMNWAVGKGLMKGKTETTINPKDNATRAEIAAILHRFIEGNK